MKKVAIIHDWLVVSGGAEKVLESLLNIYPDADVYSLIDKLEGKDRSFLHGKKVGTSFLQKLPYVQKYYTNLLPLFPLAIETLELDAYDLIVSSSYCVAKGVKVSPHQKHICYCHSPVRYAWDMEGEYLEKFNGIKTPLAFLMRYFLSKLRVWDVVSSNRVDLFVANSSFVADRIWKYYRRDSVVVHPPVNTDMFSLNCNKGEYYIFASRMVRYKKASLVAEVFSKMPDRKIVFCGTGEEEEIIREYSQKFNNIVYEGWVGFDRLVELIGGSKGFVFPAFEDFGIAPIEAMSSGTPIIALAKGGALDYLKEGVNGVGFREQSVEAMSEALDEFEKLKFSPDVVASTVQQSAVRFEEEFSAVERELYETQRERAG